MDPEAKNKAGKTPLHFASNFGCSEIVELLLKIGVYVDPFIENKDETPLILAVFSGKLTSAQLLLEARANANQQSYVSKTNQKRKEKTLFYVCQTNKLV